MIDTEMGQYKENTESEASVSNAGKSSSEVPVQAGLWLYQLKFFKYSRLFQVDFFSKNRYDEELLGRKITPAELSMGEYQSLLIYAIIKSNIPKGSAILRIGQSEHKYVEDKLSEDYRFYELPDPSLLKEDDFPESLIPCSSAETVSPGSFVNFFDIVFTLSGLDFISNGLSNKEMLKVVSNLSLVMKPGGIGLITLSSVFRNATENLSYITFKFFEEAPNTFKPLVGYTPIQQCMDDKWQLMRFDNPTGSSISGIEFRPFSYNVFIRKDFIRIPRNTITKPGQFLHKHPAYIFHHIVKCGGSSLVLSLQNWFQMEYDHLIDNKQLNNFIKFRYNTEIISSDTCITSHFIWNGIFPMQRYPEILTRNNEFKMFTFVRDPLKFKISFYYYSKMKGASELDNLRLIDFLTCEQNFLSSLIPCSLDNYKEVLDKYYFIGIVERMQESVCKFAALIGKKPFKVRKVNISEKDEQLEELTEDFVEKFRELNYLDYLVYDYCNDKLDKL